MVHFNISTKLPAKLASQLKKCSGVNVREECEIKIFELVNSEEGTELFYSFLKDGKKSDPLIYASFGPILHPYVSPPIQVEVQDILSSFQPLMAADFLPGAGPVVRIPAPALVLGGFQFQQAKIACLAVVEEIQLPNRIGAALVGINSVPSGQVICDLNLTYANCVVVIRIRKF